MKRLWILALGSLLLTQCNWFKKDDQLPAPTQEGKQTFGCKVNGEVWRPSGNDGTSNREASYDYDPNFGWFVNIRASRYEDGKIQSMAVQSIGVENTGEYLLDKPGERGANFSREGSCTYLHNQGDYTNGKLIITKLDKVNYIVAGTFEFTVAKADCDTIRVTEGRFDMRYGY